MKKLIFILMIPFLGISQTQFDYLPEGGIPIIMNSSVEACFFFNFDGDQMGTNELKIVHGLNSGCYITSTTGTPVYMPTYNSNNIDLWSDCDSISFFNWTSDTAYISASQYGYLYRRPRLNSGSHVLPFKYNGKIGFFVLKLSPRSDVLIVRGYQFNINYDDFECYQINQ